MDDKAKTGSGDDTRINVNEPYELQYWSEKFDISREQLKEAVTEAGTNADSVEEYLRSLKDDK